jgi:hypothetical protein
MRQALFIVTIIALLAVTAFAQAPKSAATPGTVPAKPLPTSIPLDPAKMKTIGSFEPLMTQYKAKQADYNTASAKAQKAYDALFTVDLEKPENGALAIYALREANRQVGEASKPYNEAATAIQDWLKKVREAHGASDDYFLSEDGKSLVKKEAPAK